MADGEEGKVQIGPIRVPDYLRPIYSNYVIVNHTPWDFRITFGVVRSPLPGEELEETKRTGRVEADAVADIIVPANLMAGLVTTLRSNFDRYLEQFGMPGMDSMGPQP